MNAKSFEEVIDRILHLEINESFDMIVAIANGGIIPAALLNQRLNLEIHLLKLNLRDSEQHQMYDQPSYWNLLIFVLKEKEFYWLKTV